MRLGVVAVWVLALVAAADDHALRVATFNVWDVSASDLAAPTERVRRVAAVIQELRPDIVLINEIVEGGGDELAAILAIAQGEGLAGIAYTVFAAPCNTGAASGFDLDNQGGVVTTPAAPGKSVDGRPAAQTAAGRAYGGDCWGFGTYPGQYAMALLVRADLDVLEARTFQLFRWDAMPGALIPDGRDGNEAWYDEAEVEAFRLSSKSHWDVPVRLADGRVVHVLASHPTPPAFDGPEQRNVRRNHDEVRFWTDYIDGASYFVDDAGGRGGLAGEHFVIVGDLNADPDEGSGLRGAIAGLLAHQRVQSVTAVGAPVEGLDDDDTAQFGLRADYVLPSAGLRVIEAGMVRAAPDGGAFPSDHFPVWVDLAIE